MRAGRLVERLLLGVGIFELLDRPDVVREIAVLEKVKRLPRRTPTREERDARQDRPDCAGRFVHGGLVQGAVKMPPLRPEG